MTLFLATYLGVPVSTTHTITGAIVGVGAARRVLPFAGTLPAISWWRVITLPSSALIAAAAYLVTHYR